MFTVALIGPDGAGKTTVSQRLEHELALPVTYLYMGVNWDASNHLLPTTRLVHAIRRRRGATAAGGRVVAEEPVRRRRASAPLRAGWAALSLLNRFAEEWYRQLIARRAVRRGSVVVFDRHFFADYYANDIAAGVRRSLGRKVHGFVLSRMYPRPDLLVYLDAPPELLLARKGEGTLESLEQRRRDYLDLAATTDHFVVVDASAPVEAVTRDVAAAIEAHAAARAGERERDCGNTR